MTSGEFALVQYDIFEIEKSITIHLRLIWAVRCVNIL